MKQTLPRKSEIQSSSSVRAWDWQKYWGARTNTYELPNSGPIHAVSNFLSLL